MKTKTKLGRNVERWKEVRESIKKESEKIREEKEKTPSRR